jgi:hypothetical protein
MALPNCRLQERGEISSIFLSMDIATYAGACAYVKSLPYGRNENKEALLAILDDNFGTCSTKHALLKRLADENGLTIDMILGIYKMNRSNTPGIGDVLEHNGLDYMPEAHNYLKAGDERFDFTFPDAEHSGFDEELLEEVVILPHQITDYKVALHKNFLSGWLIANKNINLPLGRLWEIREQCIANLSQKEN